MSYKFFDKKYLVMPDDKGIIGKKVFYGHRLYDLIEEVEDGNPDHTSILTAILGDDCCFKVGNGQWSLAYCDPNYEAKIAYSQGKQIQYITFDGRWEDITEKPLWCERNIYRVKPDTWYVHPSADEYGNCIGQPFYKDTSNKTFVAFEGTEEECDKWIEKHTPETRRYTNRELARWLAEGKGLRVDVTTNYVSAYYVYAKGEEDDECDEDIRIREWDSDEWHEPLVEVKE